MRLPTFVKLLFAIVFGGFAACATAAADWRTNVARTVEAALARTGFPAASIAIVSNGRIEYLRGFGSSDIENGTPAHAGTVYRIASVSKPITATAVMQLAEKGKIRLDTSIRAYVPALPAHYGPVTVRDLLRHTGGVRHYKDDGEFVTTRSCERLEDSLPIFAADPLDHPPGEKITYSSWGYTLLGLAVEHASGLRFAEYVERQIFAPAGMKATRPDSLRIIAHRAAGYASEKGGVRNSDPLNTSCRIPAGGFVSTAGDLARFAIALGDGRLLKAASLDEMMRSHLTPAMVRRTAQGLTLPKGFVFPGLGLG